jgi:chemotaxis response regulator CheB
MRHIRIGLVDDHAIVRRSLRMLIDREPDMEVVCEADNGVEAIEVAKAHRLDVMLIDVRLPQMDGFNATRTISSQVPTTRVILFSMLNGDSGQSSRSRSIKLSSKRRPHSRSAEHYTQLFMRFLGRGPRVEVINFPRWRNSVGIRYRRLQHNTFPFAL